jgi:membrane-bound metal-dependent hydrolase YbcI (DUF457 family)
MANAVAHILFPLIAVELYKDYLLSDRRKFSLHYILLAGLAGLLPDIDVAFYWVMNGFSRIGLQEIHRTFTHSLFFPLVFLLLAFVFWRKRWGWLGRHKVEPGAAFLVIAFGVFFHLLLDYLLCGVIMLFYPFSNLEIGLNLIGGALEGTLISGLDAVLLAGWLIHEELKHKISDFF